MRGAWAFDCFTFVCLWIYYLDHLPWGKSRLSVLGGWFKLFSHHWRKDWWVPSLLGVNSHIEQICSVSWLFLARFLLEQHSKARPWYSQCGGGLESPVVANSRVLEGATIAFSTDDLQGSQHVDCLLWMEAQGTICEQPAKKSVTNELVEPGIARTALLYYIFWKINNTTRRLTFGNHWSLIKGQTMSFLTVQVFLHPGGFSLGNPNTKLDNVTAVLKGIATVYVTRSRLKIGLIIIMIVIYVWLWSCPPMLLSSSKSPMTRISVHPWHFELGPDHMINV